MTLTAIEAVLISRSISWLSVYTAIMTIKVILLFFVADVLWKPFCWVMYRLLLCYEESDNAYYEKCLRPLDEEKARRKADTRFIKIMVGYATERIKSGELRRHDGTLITLEEFLTRAALTPWHTKVRIVMREAYFDLRDWFNEKYRRS